MAVQTMRWFRFGIWRLGTGLSALILTFWLAAGTWGQENSDRGPDWLPNAIQQQAAEDGITESCLRAHIKFLADDLLEGRGPGSRGDDLTMRYIATQFQMLGLQPAAGYGNWVQDVPLVGVTTRAPRVVEFVAGRNTLELKYNDDFIMASGQPVESTSLANAEIVFVGYGIQAPEYNWDDYKNVDVRSKVLLFMNNDPADDPELFAGRTRLYYGRWGYKYQQAAKMGARGALIIHTNPSAGYPFQVVQTSWAGEQMALDGSEAPRLPMEGWLTEDAARRLVSLSGKDLDALRSSAERADFRPVPLETTLSVDLKSMVRKANTGNVLALLPGSDPELSRQWLVIMAHHDHLGMTEPRDGADNIYNGAVDNASGVGVMLSIARAMSRLPAEQRPRRSILFASVGAEEQGLLGSEYFSLNPPIPVGRIAAVINIDGINILGPTEDVVLIGKGKSDLDEIVHRTARWQNRVMVGDQHPEQGLYYRSDQFSLAKVGVPGIYLGDGVHVVGKTPEWGRAKIREWNDTVYHQTSDEYQEDWNLRGAIDDARLLFHVGLQIANRNETPAWNPGDEFEAARKKALAEAGE